MRKIIDSIFIGFCVILLTVVSSNSQEANKEPVAANKPAEAASKQPKAKAKQPVIACTETNDLTNKEIVKILERHNKERATVKSPDIVWDCSLAKLAQEWATRGKAEHRPDNFLGENIFVSSDPKAKATQSVKQWVREKKRLIPGTMNCQPGKICLHYTQVVAAISLKLGCGINRNATGKWKTLMVCNYDPNGNGY